VKIGIAAIIDVSKRIEVMISTIRLDKLFGIARIIEGEAISARE
jgi:hypothetical protein